MAAEGFYRREVDKMPYFDFSTGKFMFKRTWQVVFWGARNYSGTPKQLAARPKARDGLHSGVVAPESGKAGTKISYFYIQTDSQKMATAGKEMNFIRVFNLSQTVFFHLTVQCSGIYFQ